MKHTIKPNKKSMLLHLSKILIISTVIMTSACIDEYTSIDSVNVKSKLESCSVTTAEPVIVFSVPWCKYCKQMKEKLKSQNINFHEINVESSTENRNMYKCMNGKGYPFLIVDGYAINVNSTNAVDKALKPHIQ